MRKMVFSGGVLALPITVVLAKFKAKHLYCANTLLKILKKINKQIVRWRNGQNAIPCTVRGKRK